MDGEQAGRSTESLRHTMAGMAPVRYRGRTCCNPDSVVFVHSGKEILLQHRDVLPLWCRSPRMRDYWNDSLRKVGVGPLTPSQSPPTF